MFVIVNGERRRCEAGTCVAALLDAAGLDRKRVAVERNGKLVRRGFFDKTALEDGDMLEIVTLVGGG